MASASIDDARLHALVDRIYEGAVQPSAWRTIVPEVVTYVGGQKGILLTPMLTPQDGGIAFLHEMQESFLQRWADHYIQHDVWTQAADRKGAFREGNVVLGEELVPHEEFLQTIGYREFFGPQGVARLCTGVIFGQDSPGLPTTACANFRDVSDPPFGEEERQKLQILVPHLSRSLGVMFRLRDAELRAAATLSALDRLSAGVVLLDSAGRVTHLNKAAEAMAALQDGLAVRGDAVNGRRLTGVSSAETAMLDKALATALDPAVVEVPHFQRAVLLSRPSGRRPWVLNVSALPVGNEFASNRSASRAIVFVTDPEGARLPDAKLLEDLYGLTPAEAKLARELASGDALAEVAARLGVSENTVKSQLKAVYDKTRTGRQAELVKLLLSLGATGTR